MIIPDGVNIPMPRPYGGTPPVITRSPKGEGIAGEVITVQFVGVIGPITQYLELLQVLDVADEDDDIVIMIDTPGGDVYTTQHIVERMESCKAKVITVASGLVASAGTFLWFFGHERRVDKWARFMFHSTLHGDWGKSLQIQETATELVNYMKDLVMKMLEAGIINGNEYDRIFGRKADVTLSGATVRARLVGAILDESDDGELEEGGEGGEGGEPVSDKKGKKRSKRRRGEGDEGGTEGDGEGDGEGEDEGETSGESLNIDAIFARNGIRAEGDTGDGDGEGEGDGDGEGIPEGRKGKKKSKKRRGEGDEGGEGEGDDGAGDGDGDGEGAPEGRCGGKKKSKKRRSEGDEGEGDDDDGEGEGDDDDGEGDPNPEGRKRAKKRRR